MGRNGFRTGSSLLLECHTVTLFSLVLSNCSRRKLDRKNKIVNGNPLIQSEKKMEQKQLLMNRKIHGTYIKSEKHKKEILGSHQ